MKDTQDANKEKRFPGRKSDVYQVITDRIIALLEAGTVPWREPWKAGRNGAQNLITRRPYRGINAFLLNSLRYKLPFWLTFKQAQSLGARVRQGEKACPVVLWKWFVVEEDGEEKQLPFLRYMSAYK